MSTSSAPEGHTEEELHDVYVCYNGLEAGRIQAILSDEGIESMIRDRSVSDFPTPNNLESRQIVAAYPSQEEKAREIIRQAIADEVISPDGHLV